LFLEGFCPYFPSGFGWARLGGPRIFGDADGGEGRTFVAGGGHYVGEQVGAGMVGDFGKSGDLEVQAASVDSL